MIRLKFKLWAERNIESLNKVFISTEFVKAEEDDLYIFEKIL